MYKPLPDSLVIRYSGIQGQGLFAKENLHIIEPKHAEKAFII